MNARMLVALGLLVAALVASDLVLPGPAAAADPPTHLLASAEEREDGSWMLVATVTGGGAVQSQRTVEFLQIADFFGERFVPLGNAPTDAAGVASRLYKPTSNGLQRVVARYQTDGETVSSDVFEIQVSGAAPVLASEAPVLPTIQALAFPVGFAILILVWLALAAILLRAMFGITRSATQEVPYSIPKGSGPVDPESTRTSSRE